MYPKIARLAGQRLPGLNREEVQVEIELALYRAWRTYKEDGGATFDGWFYRTWVTHRINLLERYYAKKNQLVVTATDLDGMIEEVGAAFGVVIPPCPLEGRPKQVWNMLADGYLFNEIQASLGIGRKTFEATLRMLRSHPDVATMLGYTEAA